MQEDLLILSTAIFNDEKKAYIALREIEGQITARSSNQSKVAYYQAAAFLANQSYEYDKALALLDQAKPLYTMTQTVPLANIWLDASAVYINQRKWKEAQAAIDRAKKFLKKKHNEHFHAHALAREGVLHLRLKNMREAQEYLLEADKCFTDLNALSELKDRHIHTLVMSSLGELFEYLQEPQNSIEAYTRVLPIIEEYKLWPRLGWHYLNAGRVSMVLTNYSDAKIYLHKSLNVAGDSEGELKASTFTNLGIVALMEAQYELAKSNFEKGAAFFAHPSKPSDYDNLAKAQWWHADLCRRIGDTAGQEDYLLSSYEEGIKGNDLYQLRRSCMELSDFYARVNVFDRALEWQKRVSDLTERYFIQLRQNDQQEINIRYELERIRQEAQFARMRVSGLQSKALRAQMNPHFLFNALNAIQGFITSGRGTEATTYLARFAKFMRQTLEYSDLEEVPLDDEINFIEKYLEINKKLRFRDKLEYIVRPPTTADASELLIPAMIIQPFVENAIEHGLRPKQAGLLTVEFKLSSDEKTLICIIEDDGVGVNTGKAKQDSHKSEHQTHRSRGMDITRERLGLLHGNALGHYVTIVDRSELEPAGQNGTRVEVIMPLLEE